MRINLDAKVETQDGKAAGNVRYAVIDPATKEVTAFAVSTSNLLGRDVLVPRQQLERAAPSGDVLRLDLSRADLDRLPSFEALEYGPPPTSWFTADLGYPLTGYLWPGTYLPPEPATDERAGVPHDFTVRKGETIYDCANQQVGVVEDVRFDAASGRLNGLVARAGGTISTMFGRGEIVEIARSEIERVAEQRVYLRGTKEELLRRFAEVSPPR